MALPFKTSSACQLILHMRNNLVKSASWRVFALDHHHNARHPAVCRVQSAECSEIFDHPAMVYAFNGSPTSCQVLLQSFSVKRVGRLESCVNAERYRCIAVRGLQQEKHI